MLNREHDLSHVYVRTNRNFAVLTSPMVKGDRASQSVPVTGRGDDFVWSLVGTLVGGPLTWGLIGVGIDHLIGTTRIFLPIGVVLGFVTSVVVIYLRFGRD